MLTMSVLEHHHLYLGATRWVEVVCVSRKRLDRRQHKQQRACRIQKRFHGLLTALLWERILPEFLDATASCFWNSKGEPENQVQSRETLCGGSRDNRVAPAAKHRRWNGWEAWNRN